jgi:hypothetical protein
MYIQEIIFAIPGLFYTFVLLFRKANKLKLLERWESGLIHRFAKPAYWETGTGGSNPPLSAERHVFGCECKCAQRHAKLN